MPRKSHRLSHRRSIRRRKSQSSRRRKSRSLRKRRRRSSGCKRRYRSASSEEVLNELMGKLNVSGVDELIGLDHVKRMTDEDVQLLKKVQGTPGVIPIEDVVFNKGENGRDFIVVMGKGTQMDTITVDQFKELAETINEIHKRDVAHMDIKLENLVLYDNRIHLIDWDANLEDRTDDLSVFARSENSIEDKKKADWFRFAALLLSGQNQTRGMLATVEYCLGQQWLMKMDDSVDDQDVSGSWLSAHVVRTSAVSNEQVNVYVRNISSDTGDRFINKLSNVEREEEEGEEGEGTVSRRLF